MAAPSARNQQPWEFYVVTNKDLIQKLSTVSPYAGCAKDALVLIVSAYREDAISPAYAQIDLSIANENIWLEADALGLGGVWLGIAPVEERMKAVEKCSNSPPSITPLPSSLSAIPQRANRSRTGMMSAASTMSGNSQIL